MELVPIEGSSNVSAIGYDGDHQLMRVRYHDGRVYDFYPVTEAEHAAVMNGRWVSVPELVSGLRVYLSPSKGRAIRMLPIGVPVGHDPTPPAPKQSSLDTLNIIESEGCCLRAFAKSAGSLDNAQFWTCPKCGVEYRPVMVGPIRNWVAHVYVSLVRA